MNDTEFKDLIGFDDLSKTDLLDALLLASQNLGWPTVFDQTLELNGTMNMAQAQVIMRLSTRQGAGYLKRINLVLTTGDAGADVKVDTVLEAIVSAKEAKTVEEIANDTGLAPEEVAQALALLQSSGEVEAAVVTYKKPEPKADDSGAIAVEAAPIGIKP